MGLFDAFKKSSDPTGKPSSIEGSALPMTEVGGDLLPPTNSGDPKKRIFILGGALTAAAAAVWLLTGEDADSMLKSLFGGESEIAAPATTDATTPEIQVPANMEEANNQASTEAADEAAASNEGEDEDETATAEEANASEPDDANLPSVATEGEGTHERAWEALRRIDEWRTSGEHDGSILKQYFSHKKAWVRLSALEIAIKQEGLSEIEVRSVAKTMKANFKADQMRRWMKRVKARDSKTYESMIKVLEL